MQSNIDGDGASFDQYDGASTDPASLDSRWTPGESAVNPTGIYPEQARLAASDSVAEPQASGKISPVPGSFLPPDTLEGNAEVLLSNRVFIAESDTAHTLFPADEAISASIDSLTELTESVDVVIEPNYETQLATGAPLQQTPVGPTSPEQGDLRSRALSEAPPGSNAQANALDANSEALLDGNPEFGQGDNAPDQSADNPFDARAQRSITAEFALNDGRTDSLTSSAFPRTGESAPGILPAPGQASGTSPLVSSSSLTLVGDRQLAGQQVAQHVASFVRQGDEYAEINLTPPHLGKISARITMQNDQATVVLSAPSPEIREIMEASLPRLSDLLEDAGLTLADANVEGQAHGNDSDNSARNTPDSDASETTNEAPVVPPREYARGLLDAYA